MNAIPKHIIEPPNLLRARAFTLVIGPVAVVGGIASGLLGVVMRLFDVGILADIVMAYGGVVAVFGLAAWARTESTLGRTMRWMVVAIFLVSGGFALAQWAELLWGSRGNATMITSNLTALGFYLMAGPALIVPGVLAAFRPAWVPLIVTPAILTIASTSAVGLVMLTMLGLDIAPFGRVLGTMICVALASVGILLWPITQRKYWR